MGVDAQEFPGGLLRLDPAFAYAEPPSSCPLPQAEFLTLAPGSDRLPVELFQILKDYAVKVLHSICNMPGDGSRHFKVSKLALSSKKKIFLLGLFLARFISVWIFYKHVCSILAWSLPLSL